MIILHDDNKNTNNGHAKIYYLLVFKINNKIKTIPAFTNSSGVNTPLDKKADVVRAGVTHSRKFFILDLTAFIDSVDIFDLMSSKFS
jgi:hypothetical protein